MKRLIRNSAKALIIRDGKMLAVRLRDGDDEWYIMPGGGQEPDETLKEAVCREVREELGMEVSCGDLAFVIEGVNGESFHRVDLVFRCEYLGEAPAAATHPDTMQTGYDWLDIANLNKLPLYPSKLRRAIMDLYENKLHPVYLGNE